MPGLRQPLTFVRGTAVMLNIVIGAGLLALPGLAVKQAGSFAFLSWVVCALVAIPLLAVFVLLGRRHPNAGGIAHFAQTAFGRKGYAGASLVFLGAVSFGLPSIALTGGHYAALLIDASPHLIAAGLLCAATLMHFLSSALVARANTALAAATLLIIFVLLVLGFWNLESFPQRQPVFILPSSSQWPLVLAPFMMIFFAFTGWEVAAGLSEEFKCPRRDFSRAMIASFTLTVSIYLAMAFLVQRLSLSDGYEVAFAQIARNALGRLGEQSTAVLASIIIFANLSGAIWAVSRMVVSLSRERFLPSLFQTAHAGTPWLAVLATATLLLCVLGLDGMGLLSLDRMLALAGQNFIVLYGIAAGALLLRATGWPERLLSIGVVLLVAVLVAGQGQIALYPVLLLGIGFCLGANKSTAPHEAPASLELAAAPLDRRRSDPLKPAL